jgi:hypothetical protein
VLKVASASSSVCLIYDRDEQTLRRAKSTDGEDLGDTAAAGIVGYVARTGERAQVENLTEVSRPARPTASLCRLRAAILIPK